MPKTQRNYAAATVLLVAFLVSTGCERDAATETATATATAPAKGATKPEAEATPAAAKPPASAETLREAAGKKICADVKGPCVVTDFKASGDADGTIYLAEVAFIEKPTKGGSWKNPHFDSEDGCNPWALYGVKASGAEIAEVSKVAHFCNDGHGASGVGEDVWSVEKGRLSVSTNGGSNWRWDSKNVVDLGTNALVAARSGSYFATGPGIYEDHEWDYESLTGITKWTALECGNDKPVERAAVMIPSLVLPADFVSGAWKSTSLGKCATSMDASATTGYVVHGAKSTAADTSLKVVASADREVFVEVLDDKLVPSSTGKWIHADHLEVWLSPDEPQKMEAYCVETSKKGKTWQWGIDANDGMIHVAHGKPSMKLAAEHVDIDGGARFKIVVPPDAKSITVVYSDSDDGKSQERLLATSTFKFANVQTMGGFTKLDPSNATCRQKGDTLVPTLLPMKRLLGNAP